MSSTIVRQQRIAAARRIVVKVGTNSITGENGRLDHGVLGDFARQIADVIHQGREVILVASGAVGAGLAELDLPGRPRELPMLQATAAVGQGRLMQAFYEAFGRRDVKVAQVLVTRDAFEDRRRYLNIRNTLTTLARLGVLPILNENDAVAVDEIRYGTDVFSAKFGDNDIIAAHVANMLDAQVLVLLSNVDGVLDGGVVLDVIEQVNDDALSVVSTTRSKLGSGGMGSKMRAAGMVTSAGSVAVIANSRERDIIPRLLSGERLGTVFVPASRRMSSRRRWIGQTSRTAGRILVDAGAAAALRQRGKSLLPSGIVAVSGSFSRGAVVDILDPAGQSVARGVANFSAADIDRIKGMKSADVLKRLGETAAAEVVHRNNMTMA